MDWIQDEPWGMEDSVRIFVYVFDHGGKNKREIKSFIHI